MSVDRFSLGARTFIMARNLLPLLLHPSWVRSSDFRACGGAALESLLAGSLHYKAAVRAASGNVEHH